MEYPPDFPEHLKPPIERAIAKAELKRLKANREPHSPTDTLSQERIAYVYVKDIFLAFAEQAREAGREQLWPMDKVRHEVDGYLHRLILSAYPKPFGFMGTMGLTMFETATNSSIKKSKEWEIHQRNMASIARLITVKSHASGSHKAKHDESELTKESILQILDDKGWSIGDWAAEAKVSYHTASDYLKGKKRPYKSTRAKLANALGISVKSLP